MMRFQVLLLPVLATGFVMLPTLSPAPNMKLKSVPVDESVIGVQAPVGFWDPLGT